MPTHPATPTEPLTLDDILALRQEKLEQIRAKSMHLHRMLDEVFTPPRASTRYEAMLNNVGRAVAIYDGIMVGIKLMRRFRHIFKR